MKILFAPLQGYTHWLYRQVHHRLFGGVESYYTPFLRYEREGIRSKDLRDVAPANNCDENGPLPVVPQVIARDLDEFRYLCDSLQQMGWNRIDLNLGCPFPMQVRAGRGSGLLPHPDRVGALVEEMARRSDVAFSVKMRLGLDDAEEALRLLPLINDSSLSQVALHPRLGVQQYKGSVDMDSFTQFYEQCRKPLVYNGDLADTEQIASVVARFPNLDGIMVGRGLLTRPWLAQEWHSGVEGPEEHRLQQLLQMHDVMMRYAEQHLQGESQMLAFLRSFWDYPGQLLPKKVMKRLMKCGNLRNYMEALDQLR